MVAPVNRGRRTAVERDKDREAEKSSPRVVTHCPSPLLTLLHVVASRPSHLRFSPRLASSLVTCMSRLHHQPPSSRVVASPSSARRTSTSLLSRVIPPPSSPAFHSLHIKLVSMKVLKT
ncbi:hypothetical protein PIB30_027870 [Stylosanthes scabra]|uniref:Uncharacterized protein n=1 Tax=Stylosanthes scabra TaxID=79078 RepID=A0ABU6WEE2_9FABA|nr:hypothetical protein [Stylosanthes scabra]